jgi:hypothetical protein
MKMQRSEFEAGEAILIMRRHADGSISNAIAVETFEEPGVWGIVLADCVQHLVNAYTSLGYEPQSVRSHIIGTLRSEIEKPTDKAYRMELED